ncbi:MAG: protein translocase subunit SecF [Ectothiorhodospiraceae bacterium]|nr:protein translocase subunit SecF [Ectothiorhodospiraceae bacterium]
MARSPQGPVQTSGIQFLVKPTSIDFLGQRRLAFILSGALILVSLLSLAVRGLNFGLDFTGGTLIELGYPDSADVTVVRSTLADGGFPEAVVQHFGTSKDVLIRIAPREGVQEAELSTEVLRVVRASPGGADVELRRVEFVGPQVGKELAEDGALALLVALVGILIYVSLRFEWRFAVGSVAALVHDAVITVGFFSVFGLEFDLTVLAAVLAVIGYSLNDTIVVFDRIRENFRKLRRGTPTEVINRSINETLSRTIMTGVTTLIVLVALLWFGGELIRGFSIALILGIVVGTYSSVYVASAIALALGVSKADLMPVKKEGEESDARP